MLPLVVVVEDEPMVAEMTARLLQAMGYRAECASTGRAALTWLERDRVGLFIIDLQLPDIPGIQLGRLVRQTLPTVPIIFVSGSPRAIQGYQGLERSLFLVKPYDYSDLEAPVRELLSEPSA